MHSHFMLEGVVKDEHLAVLPTARLVVDAHPRSGLAEIQRGGAVALRRCKARAAGPRVYIDGSPTGSGSLRGLGGRREASAGKGAQ